MLKSVKLAVVVVLISLLTGCIGTPSVNIAVSPDPIKFKFDETTQEITFKFKTQGFGNLKLDTLVLELLNDSDEEIWNEEVELDASTFVIPGGTHEEKHSVTLPSDLQYATEELYNAEIKGKTYTLVVTITGGKDVTKNVDVIFE